METTLNEKNFEVLTLTNKIQELERERDKVIFRAIETHNLLDYPAYKKQYNKWFQAL